MPSALAIVLLLNGVQVDLPQPALLVGGVACVPLRAVCERLGAEVTLDADHGQALVQASGKTRAFPLAKGLSSAAGGAIKLEGCVYVPAKALAGAVGGRCQWDGDTRTVSLEFGWLGQHPLEASREKLVRDPLAWRGCLVRVEGRLGGRLAPPLSPGTAGVPPADEHFVLQEPWSMYCGTQELTGAAPPPPPLSRLGRPTAVTGYVALDRRGHVFLKAFRLEDTAVRTEASARVSADCISLPAERTRFLTALLRNDGPARLELPPNRQPLDIWLESPAGETASLGPPSPAAGPGVSHGLAPGAEAARTIPWRPSAAGGRQAIGEWHASLRPQPGTEPIETSFLVAAPPSVASPEPRR